MTNLTKVCTKCKIEKPVTEYHKTLKGKFGVRSICNVCCNVYFEARKKPKIELKVIVNQEGEIWADVPGYEGLYQVSNYGRMKACRKIFHMPNGGIRVSVEKELQPIIHHDYECYLLQKDGNKKWFKVHRIVLTVFDRPPAENEVGNHLDGNKRNNHHSNLEWCTPGENQLHAIRIGLKKVKKGFDHPLAKNILDREKGITYSSIADAAKAEGVTFGTLSAFINGRGPMSDRMKVRLSKFVVQTP